MKNAILKGKAGNLNGIIESGFNGLGDPAKASNSGSDSDHYCKRWTS
ncbi:MAG: hypothetical protein R2809_00130 [Flavobacteriales bacterium]